jgi:prevent-host-death family protein
MTMVKKRQVPAGEFKAKCLALLDEVAETGTSLVVTKRGRPVAEVVPYEAPKPLSGSVKIRVSEDELLAPVADWDADRA